ncbi:MAG: hypothetical protein NT085_03930 [candidate division SR1 bacterium]|nr:hypothetical protein [candidate division SR1 bacterium]
MNLSDLKSIVDLAENASEGDDPSAQAIKIETNKFKDKVRDVMGKSYDKLTKKDLIPKSIADAADDLRKAYGS